MATGANRRRFLWTHSHIAWAQCVVKSKSIRRRSLGNNNDARRISNNDDHVGDFLLGRKS